MEKETRNLNQPLKINEENRKIEGYAIVFDSQSEDLGFREYIHKSAVTPELLKRSDVFALLDHDANKILARSKNGVGNLKLTIDDVGLKYEFEALKNDLGDTVLEYVKTNMINSSSFAFTIADGGDKWTRTSDGTLQRDIYNFDALYDVSPVFNAAYSKTTCNCRSLDDFLNEELRKKEILKKLSEIEEEIKNA